MNAGGKDELMLSIRFLLEYLSLETKVQGVLLCLLKKEKGVRALLALGRLLASSSEYV